MIEKNGSNAKKATVIIATFLAALSVMMLSVGLGSVKFSFEEILQGLFGSEKTPARLLIWNVRLPRTLGAAMTGTCLSLAGCLLQGVMRNDMASPSTIGVTGGASFVAYVTLVFRPDLSQYFPIAAIIGAFITTMIIYAISYNEGVLPITMILSGMAISSMFGAFNDIIKSFFADNLHNVVGFLVGSFNGISWGHLKLISGYALTGILACFFLPTKLNILMLGDEMSNSLGLNTERFRFILIVISSLLSGAAIATAGLINFVGLIIPHLAKLLVGSDYRFQMPASMGLGVLLVVTADLIGRTILPVGEVSASVLISFLGAPFFLYLLRRKKRSA